MALQGSGRIALLAMPGIAAVHAALHYSTLPERVASHFDAAGTANGSMGRLEFVAFYVGLVVFLSIVFGGIGMLMRALPPEMMNMPNRVYWLAPERRVATANALGNDLAWFGVLTCCLIVAAMELTFRANQSQPPHLSPMVLYLIVGYMVAELIWVVRMILRFSRVP